MTKGFAPILKLAVKSQAQRAEKRHLTPLGDIQANLLNYVAELPDPRVQRTQKHLLKDILVISILAVISGAEGWEDMENYGIAKQQWLEEFLELPNGIPSDDTFRRVGCISLWRMCLKRDKMKKLVKSLNTNEANKMTPSDQQQLKAHLKAVAEIFYINTDPTELKSFESIEKSLREKMLEEVGPELGSFFFQQYQEFKQENPEK